MENEIFGVYFTDLPAAREAARHINLGGRDVAIYERKTGKVVEYSKAAETRPLTRPAPAFSVVPSSSQQNAQPQSGAE
jgi:hypothetical protein